MSDPGDGLPGSAIAAARGRVGAPTQVLDASRDGGAARVACVRGPRGAVWVKAHRQSRTADQEVRAIDAARRASLPVPQVHDAADGWLVLSDVAGAAPTDAAAWARAGRWLAGWHRWPLDDADVMSLTDALGARAVAWRRRAAAIGAPDLADALEPREAERAALAAARRVWCHRDFHPRNWLDDGRRCAVIDFEHARPDAAAFDLAKVRASGADPAWIDAFEQAYAEAGGPGLASAPLVALGDRIHAVQTLIWGVQRGDAAVIGEGLAAMRRSGIAVDEGRFTVA